MRRIAPLALTVLAACEGGRPDRADPTAFPEAVEETDLEAVLTTCAAKLYPFEAESRGFHPTVFDGVATVTYTDEPNPVTTIVLKGCGPDRNHVIGLPFHGAGHLTRGQFDVSRDAATTGGFLFSYRDNTEFEEVNCSNEPEGEVTVYRAARGEVNGRFDVSALCETADDRNPGEYRRTRFRGTFRAVELAELP